MALVVVTARGGLVGSGAARFFAERGWDVIGLDDDVRARFFGPEDSTSTPAGSVRMTLAGASRAT